LFGPCPLCNHSAIGAKVPNGILISEPQGGSTTHREVKSTQGTELCTSQFPLLCVHTSALRSIPSNDPYLTDFLPHLKCHLGSGLSMGNIPENTCRYKYRQTDRQTDRKRNREREGGREREGWRDGGR